LNEAIRDSPNVPALSIAAGTGRAVAVAETQQTIRVLPNLEQARRQTLYLIRSRQVELENGAGQRASDESLTACENIER